MIVALSIISLSVATTLFFSDFLLDKLDGKDEGGYRNVTFTDAVLKCQTEARNNTKVKLQQITLDDHSSRLDENTNQFKIFLKATRAGADASEAQGTFYINCFVNGFNGRIAYYEGMEQKASRTEAIRKDEGGLFGWPLN